MVRVVVLGFDGFDELMVSLSGELGSGFSVYMLDSFVPLTPPSWASIMSGVNPGKHGVLGFYYVWREASGWRWRLQTALDLDYPRVHEATVLARADVRVAVVNPLPDYPLTVRGASRVFAANLGVFGDVVSSDDKLFSKLVDVEGFRALIGSRKEGGVREYVKVELETLDYYEALLEGLIGLGYDLVWVNVPLPDHVLHRVPEALWGRRGVLERVVSRLDRLVRLARRGSPNVVVVSDHGFRAMRGAVRVNALLYREGLAVRARDPSRVFRVGVGVEGARVVGGGFARLVYRLARGRLRGLARAAYRFVSRVYGRLTGRGLAVEVPADVDSLESKAFAPVGLNVGASTQYVLLNDVSVADRVVGLLRSYGVEAYRPEELIWGPHVPRNLLFVYSGEYRATPGTIYDEPVVERKDADHYRYGVFAFRFEDVDWAPEGRVVPNYAVAPVVMALLGMPLDRYMDGYRFGVEVAERMGRRVEHFSYQPRWRLYKRLLRVGHARRAA